MDSLQNLTAGSSETSTKNTKSAESKVTPQQQVWIDFRALNGTVIEYNEDTGTEKLGKIKISDLASRLGVSRQTLYDWEKIIPGFWDLVAERKKELGGQRRLSLFEDKWFMKALEMKNWQISEAWLRHYKPDYKEAKQKLEHEVGNSIIDLFKQVEQEQQDRPFIEAETAHSDKQQ